MQAKISEFIVLLTGLEAELSNLVIHVTLVTPEKKSIQETVIINSSQCSYFTTVAGSKITKKRCSMEGSKYNMKVQARQCVHLMLNNL